MIFVLLLLLAQDPPAAPTTAGDKMAASIEKQREAAKRQTKALGLHADDEPAVFFTTPWPRPQPLTPAPPAPTAQPAALVCDPLSTGQLESIVRDAARREQLAPDLLRAVIRQESAGYPCAVSRQGAQGLMQLMPSTARQLAVRNAMDPRQNVDAGAHLLRQLLDRYPGDLASALAAYNAGPAPVDQHGGVPPYAETQNYVQQILGWLTGQGVEQ
mgnify:CR=1 FL=1